MFQYKEDNVSKLPYDHHELCAMVAPRALLVLGNPDYVWLADESGHYIFFLKIIRMGSL